MRFIHIADVHLGADPDSGSARRGKREKEIWDSLEKILSICEEQKTELLLIAGDLFHRQPLKRELKELNYMFGRLTVTEVVMIAGNHDYLKRDSYYLSFEWEKNVHMILSPDLSCVEFPEYSVAVYGFSYSSREITEECCKGAFAQGKQSREILLVHGGDEKHVPMKKEELLELGYDYIALGHIHKPQQLYPGRAAYAGALEPVDKNDTGMHGYISGEITEEGVRTVFVPAALREYIHLTVPVTGGMTGHGIKEETRKRIEEKGVQHIYKIILTGHRDPEIMFDTESLDTFGNIIEVIDNTTYAYQFSKLKEQNRENILGQFIESFSGSEKDSMEYQALCEGVHALMETRRG